MEQDGQIPKKTPLLKKFDIPIQRLDFSYVRKCTDVRELEKILKILRSGEEGHFPELMTFVDQRLMEIDPSNRLLRPQKLPVLRTQYLDKEERQDLIQDISDWIQTIEKSSSSEEDASKYAIFDDCRISQGSEIPIRGKSKCAKKGLNKGKEKMDKPQKKGVGFGEGTREGERIKSWEYEKWDKFDVEEALSRLDVLDLQREEWEKVQRPRIQEEQEKGGSGGVERLMKNLDNPIPGTTPTSKSSQKEEAEIGRKKNKISPPPLMMDVSVPSFMEEISESDYQSSPGSKISKPKTTTTTPPRGQRKEGSRRRFRVEIEDVHLGF